MAEQFSLKFRWGGGGLSLMRRDGIEGVDYSEKWGGGRVPKYSVPPYPQI